MNKADYSNALKHSRKAESILHKNSRIKYMMATALLELGDIKLAKDKVNEILENEPRNAFALELLGDILISEEKFDEAKIAFQRAIDIEPSSTKARNSLAFILLSEGKNDEAKKHWELVLELDEENTEALENLAEYYFHLQKYQVAMHYFNQLEEIDYHPEPDEELQMYYEDLCKASCEYLWRSTQDSFKNNIALTAEHYIYRARQKFPANDKFKIYDVKRLMSETGEKLRINAVKAEKILDGRASMVFESDSLDWGMAETLAYGSLLEEGFNVRMSGQDVERGTFSHRHAILRDEISEERINLLNINPASKGEMYIYNSLLSEYAVLGFDYGYAMANPNTLTLWEAQFGDFSNGAQIIFDQYLSVAEDKWKSQNGIVVLLPHGYEGQGSEHSSARMERFLQLCGDDNLTVADCTTPANIFHLLRRQMKRDFRKPLIVFTPKSLLRHPKAVSSLNELVNEQFKEVIDDTIHPEHVKRLVFCTGKFYYDLLAERETLNREDVALVRIEQLFPLHLDKIQQVINRYPNVKEYAWAQEEPKNMGAWSFMAQRMDLVKLNVISRPYNSVPAPGSNTRDKQRQKRVIDTVFEIL